MSPSLISTSLPQRSPVRRVGIIGGGQLAWMMAEAAQQLDVELIVQTPESTDPAVAIAAATVLAPIRDAAATAKLAAQCDVITFENEFVDLQALQQLAASTQFHPSLTALTPLLDKYDQRTYLQQLGIPTPQFWTGPPQTIPPMQLPVVLKTRRQGYDGQGTFIIHDRATWQEVLGKLGDTPVVVEEFIPFERELAVMAARSQTGEVVVYPIVETQQEQQVCRRVIAPAAVSADVVATVVAIAHQLLESLQFVGILGIEFFLTAGQVLVNEIAPRTHNSGHYTLDACSTSQFAQQLRAVCGLPLSDPTMRCAGAVMVNLLGYETSNSDYQAIRQQLAALPNAHLHWYGKAARPGRKLGHVTVLFAESVHQQQAIAAATAIEAIWYRQG
jgi:5-(carboxyamino)imidazole ribonucleotide synthase